MDDDGEADTARPSGSPYLEKGSHGEGKKSFLVNMIIKVLSYKDYS